jgi:phage gpG-like protein
MPANDVTATIDYSVLQHVVGVVQRRGSTVLAELAPAIAESLVNEVLEVFETKGQGSWDPYWWETRGLPRPSGRRWQGSPKMLQDTGNLVGSITPAWDDESAEAYTNVPYGKFHVTGTKWMPARNFLDFDRDAFEGDIADMILLRLDRAA